VRKLVSVLLMAAVAVIAVAASLDAFRSSSGETSERTRSASSGTTSVRQTTAPPPSFWGDGLLYRWTIRLGQRRRTWEETMMLDPGTYELTFQLDVPHGADIELSFQSSTEARVTFGLFGPRVPRECQRRNGRDVCSGGIEIEQHGSEAWTLIARTLSEGRAVVHLQFTLTRVPPAGE
jgi:hypothetical protein